MYRSLACMPADDEHAKRPDPLDELGQAGPAGSPRDAAPSPLGCSLRSFGSSASRPSGQAITGPMSGVGLCDTRSAVYREFATRSEAPAVSRRGPGQARSQASTS